MCCEGKRVGLNLLGFNNGYNDPSKPYYVQGRVLSHVMDSGSAQRDMVEVDVFLGPTVKVPKSDIVVFSESLI